MTGGTVEVTVLFQCETSGEFTGYIMVSALDEGGTVLKTDEFAVAVEITVP